MNDMSMKHMLVLAIVTSLAWSAQASAQDPTHHQRPCDATLSAACTRYARHDGLFADGQPVSTMGSGTSLFGAIDMQVLSTAVSARLRQVRERAIADMVRGAAGGDTATPLADLLTTLGALLDAHSDGTAIAQSLASAAIRDGISYAIAGLTEAGIIAAQDCDGSIHYRASVVYEAIAQTQLASLGFPSATGNIPTECTQYATTVSNLIDALAAQPNIHALLLGGNGGAVPAATTAGEIPDDTDGDGQTQPEIEVGPDDDGSSSTTSTSTQSDGPPVQHVTPTSGSDAVVPQSLVPIARSVLATRARCGSGLPDIDALLASRSPEDGAAWMLATPGAVLPRSSRALLPQGIPQRPNDDCRAAMRDLDVLYSTLMSPFHVGNEPTAQEAADFMSSITGHLFAAAPADASADRLDWSDLIAVAALLNRLISHTSPLGRADIVRISRWLRLFSHGLHLNSQIEHAVDAVIDSAVNATREVHDNGATRLELDGGILLTSFLRSIGEVSVGDVRFFPYVNVGLGYFWDTRAANPVALGYEQIGLGVDVVLDTNVRLGGHATASGLLLSLTNEAGPVDMAMLSLGPHFSLYDLITFEISGGFVVDLTTPNEVRPTFSFSAQLPLADYFQAVADAASDE